MTERRFTDLELERKLAGDLSPARAAALDTEATAADKARLAELEAESASFMASIDVENEVRRIQQRVERMTPAPKRPAWLRWLVPAGALMAAAAALLLVFFHRKPSERVPPIDDDFSTKGDDISLVIHTATDGGDSAKLANGDTITPGARLRFEVQGSKPGFIAVVGIDGSAATTIYYPWGASEAAPLGTERLLPHAIQIDATPGDEKFFAVFSTRPFSVDTVMPAITGAGTLPPGVSMSEVVLHKK
jgi:hypothetical protein